MNIDYKVAEVELSYKTNNTHREVVRSSDDTYRLLLSVFNPNTIEHRESFKVLYINQANEIMGYTTISEGGIASTVVDVRIILQGALLTNSVAMILAHNHPSGNVRASQEDRNLTEKIVTAAKIMNIKVLDHLIITPNKFLSFNDEGLL